MGKMKELFFYHFSRKKGLYTRDKSKLFLKNNSDIEDGLVLDRKKRLKYENLMDNKDVGCKMTTIHPSHSLVI
jgi:hypothetical protein